MIIKKYTEMLLFRYSNYKKHSFISEHNDVLTEKGQVWMLKLGRKSNAQKLKSIADNGGWLVLRAPKADGGSSYIAHFVKVQEDVPQDAIYPQYYKDILEGTSDDFFYFSNSSRQWFKLDGIKPLDEKAAASLIISKTGKKVDDVINTTRTAVMFIKNELPIEA